MKAQHIMRISVRPILQGMTATIAFAGLFAAAQPMNAKPIRDSVGLQLYSVRAQLGKDVSGTLAEVQSWGVKYVELAGTYNLSPADFKSQLDAHGMVALSGHFSFDQWASDPEAVLSQADALGLKYVGCAWIPHEGAFDEATCRKAIEVFDRAGAAAAKHHMKFFYHTHGYEFQPFGDGTLFDLLMQGTDAKTVKFEMDIFWIAHAGQDPVKLLAKYPKRFELMHLKDMRKETQTGLLTGGTDVKNDAALGEGKLDLPAILKEARKIKVKWYFIEDESPVSEQQIPVSLKYLDDFKD
jgi:sugar phosphate isomerase/epimerase